MPRRPEGAAAANTRSIQSYSVSGEWTRFAAPPEDLDLNTTVLFSWNCYDYSPTRGFGCTPYGKRVCVGAARPSWGGGRYVGGTRLCLCVLS
jgi:hypothetical protein